MKFKTTAKEIRRGYGRIIALGYCEAEALLLYKKPVAYASGVYGWNFDLYDIDGVAVCTGYRGMPGTLADYNLINELNRKATNATAEECEVLLKQLIDSVFPPKA